MVATSDLLLESSVMLRNIIGWLKLDREGGPVAKKKLFIHAGTYKTGTTYFQHKIYHNRKRLAAAGILYPRLGLGLATPHNRHSHRVLGMRLASGKQNGFPKIIERLTSNSAVSTGLISYEGFCMPQTIDKLLEIRDCFADVELEAILVFLRA